MTPLKVTAHMAEPIIYYEDSMHLDGILSWGWWRKECQAGREDEYDDPAHIDWPDDPDLPLARWHAPPSGGCYARLLDSGRLWGWRASDIIIPDGVKRGSVAARRMVDVDDMVRHTDAARLKTSSGKLKPKDKTYPTIFAHGYQWYAVGDPDGVHEYLREVTHIGKLTGHGQGRVKRWQVDEIDEDRSIVHGGRLMRTMPESFCEADRATVRDTIRPLYWHPSRQVERCYPSGTEVADA